MCGITGYVGHRVGSVVAVLDNLKRLEYRGYDSAGVARVDDGGALRVARQKGKIAALIAELDSMENAAGGAVIAHTRWATHGRPSQENAHPHTDEDAQFAVVHNGIIENYLPLKDQLLAAGHVFSSETDTEVLVHLMESRYAETPDVEQAVRGALQEVQGSYAVAVVCRHAPGVVFVARQDSPLVIGRGMGEQWIASDIPAVLRHTRDILILEDGDFGVVTADQVRLSTLAGSPLARAPFPVTWDVAAAEKGGYDHFMLKEIFEQPQAIRDTLRGRIAGDNAVQFPELKMPIEKLLDFTRIVIVACGTAYHAGMVGKSFFEHLLRRPVEVQVASEFRYSDPIVDGKTLAIIISQSGETADTLAALREAKVKGATTLAVVNVVGSSIAREADEVVYTYAGPEISVASTKAYVTQLVALYLIGLFLAQSDNKLGPGVVAEYVEHLKALPAQVGEILQTPEPVEALARQLASSSSFFFLGRGFDFAVALEAALKLKEVSYIHAEAYPAGEMKHGPLALVEPGVSVVCFATQSALYEKMLSNVKEIKARDGFAVAVVKEGDEGLDDRSVDAVLRVPTTHDTFMPILAIVPMQLLAYHIAAHLGREIDQPRNLAKSVTVE